MAITAVLPDTLRIALSGSNNVTEIILPSGTRTAFLKFVDDNGRVQLSGSASTGTDGSTMAEPYITMEQDQIYPVRLTHVVKEQGTHGRGGMRRNTRHHAHPLRRESSLFVATSGAGTGDILEVRTSTATTERLGYEWPKYQVENSIMLDPNSQLVSRSSSKNGLVNIVLDDTVAALGPTEGVSFFWQLQVMDS